MCSKAIDPREVGRLKPAFERDARLLVDQVEHPLGRADGPQRFPENRDPLRRPRATRSAYSMNEMSAPVVISPATMRPPPTQMASRAADSPATTEIPPSAARACTLRLANSSARASWPVESHALGGLLRERADRANAGQHFRRGRAGFAMGALNVRRSRFDAPPEHRRREQHGRQAKHHEQREPGRCVEQQARAAHDEHGVLQRVRQFLAERVFERRHVRPQARRDLAGVTAVEELNVLPQQRLEHQPPHANAEALRAPGEEEVAAPRRAGLEQKDSHQDERQLVQPPDVPSPMASSRIRRTT